MNLIQLKPDHEHLRDTIFWDIFRNTLIFQDENAALAFRETQLKRNLTVPVIYTLTGRRIASGFYDPDAEEEQHFRRYNACIYGQLVEPIPSKLLQRRERLQNEWRASESVAKKQEEWIDVDREIAKYSIELDRQIEEEKAIVMVEAGRNGSNSSSSSNETVVREDGVRIVAGKVIQKKRKPEEMSHLQPAVSSSSNNDSQDTKRPRF